MNQKVVPADTSIKSPSKGIQFANHGENNNKHQSTCLGLFTDRVRFLIMILVLLCLASIWSNILSFNFALICFIKSQDTDSAANFTSAEASDDRSAIQFTPRQKSFLTSAVAASALIFNFIVVYFVNKFGIRIIFTIAGCLSAVGTLLLPTAIYSSFYFTLGCRIIQGIAFAANFPVIGAFTGKWTYFKQNGLFVSVLVAYVQFSPAITMPISGALCESRWSWPSVFYVHGTVGIILFTLFPLLYRNSPQKHPCVSTTELNKITIGKSSLNKNLLRKIPYVDILKTTSVWAVWIAAIGNFTAVNLMFLYSPTYMSQVLGFPVHQSGLSSALPPLAQFCIKLAAGFTSDKVKFLSETNKLRLYNSIAFFGCASFLITLAFFPTSMPYVCLILFGFSAGILGFTTGGFFKAGPLVSKHYSHFVTGNISMGITITMLIVPFLVNGIAPDNTVTQWRYILIITAAVLCVTNLLFALMCSAKPAYWTTDGFSTSGSSQHDILNNSTISSITSVNKVHSSTPAT